MYKYIENEKVECLNDTKKNQRSLQLAESVHDDFWGTGLNKVGTEHTDHRKSPGWKIMGQIYSNVVCSFEKATTEIWVFSKEYIGINSVIFNTC